ncbi:MAG: hypothetical protein AB2793_09925 [Candidatus Thiodiazotropha sp.]
MIDSELVEALYKGDKRKDLLDLLLEESKYTIPVEEYTGEVPDLSMYERELQGCAIDHLRFVTKYGFIKEKVNDNGKIYSPYYEEFKDWLKAGCPGLLEVELQAYVNENPVNT